MQLDRRIIESGLLKKGFYKRDGDHRYFYHVKGGKETGIRTFVSTGTGYKTYGMALLGEMKKQLGLDRATDLVNLCKCPMSGEDYNAILESKGMLRAPTKPTRRPKAKSRRRRRRK